jgi:hypothetical protein
MPVRPQRVQFSKAAYVRAYLDGTHQQLQEAERAPITREIAYDTEMDRIKQRRKDAKQHIKEAASTWAQLERINRYERRALSRRNKAIKAFDEACAAADCDPSSFPEVHSKRHQRHLLGRQSWPVQTAG